MPSELNLSPVYRHRLDEQGNVLEMDVIWPIFHYETRPDGGADFRIRPFYRYLTESPNEVLSLPTTEHQFLWPLGRVRGDDEQLRARLFPLYSYSSRLNENGEREKDWYFLFPFFWGGSKADGSETYFAVWPIYGDIPDFLTYERFQWILFPFYVYTEKSGWTGKVIQHQLLWPFIAWGWGEKGNVFHRVLPLYSYWVDPRFRRFSLLWPFIHWGTERLDSDDPVSRFWLFPLWGRMTSQKVDAWAFLWPFFQKMEIEDRFYKLDFLWPFFRYQKDNAESDQRWQWWLWPVVGRTLAQHSSAWNFLWPLFWISDYDDPEGTMSRFVFLPFYTHYNRDRRDLGENDHKKFWPFYHNTVHRDEDGEVELGDWRILSLWPFRGDNAAGVRELYGWLWTLAKGQTRKPDDHSTELIANIYTTRTRGTKTQTSVPFLFNIESDEDGGVFRLFQFIPIPFGSPGPATKPEADLTETLETAR